MVDPIVNERPDTAQWAGDLLDRLVAPKCSALIECLAPDLAELPNYFGSFFLNNVFVARVPDTTRSLTIVFLRRLTNAVRGYRLAREQLLGCVAALRHSNSMVQAYLKALSHFENVVVDAYLALLAHDAVAKIMAPEAERAFKKGDGTPAQRLNAAYNALKHFDDNVAKGNVSGVAAPLWLVSDGIECAGSEGEAKLYFAELVELLGELEQDARFISEDAFKLIRHRSAESNSN